MDDEVDPKLLCLDRRRKGTWRWGKCQFARWLQLELREDVGMVVTYARKSMLGRTRQRPVGETEKGQHPAVARPQPSDMGLLLVWVSQIRITQ